MGLSGDLISEFVKITNDKNTEEKKESIVYGTTVEYNEKKYVKIDGSDLLTPITSTADARAGERVTVMIKNHTATVTGNISSPAARSADVKGVEKAISDAAAAQATANNKKRVFVSTPSVPYDVGDLWVQGSSGDILNCKTAKTPSQSYASSDWVKASKYTDDTAANKAQSDVNALTTRVSSAETEISQNKEAIALRATKTEVAESLSGYYTKEQTDAKIKVESDKIASAVTRISNNEESISLLVKKVQDLQEQINALRTS